MILPFPSMCDASIVRSSPPTSVQARPVTCPTAFSFSAIPYLNFFTPENFSKFLFVIDVGLSIFFLVKSLSLTTFLKILAICLSNPLTPASLV